MNTHEPWLRTLVRSQSSGFSPNLRSDRGASAVEYGLLIAGIAALIVVIVFAFGDNIKDIFSDTCGQVAGTSGTCVKD